jgi:FkbM family methyltransferase
MDPIPVGKLNDLSQIPFALRCARGLIHLLPRGRYGAIYGILPWLQQQKSFIGTYDDRQLRCVMDLRKELDRSLFFYGFHEQAETSLFLHALRPGFTVVDAGANWGYYVLLASRRIGPTGKVYAFEPDPRNAAALRFNVSLHRENNIVVEEKAIAAQNGLIPFSAATDKPGDEIRASSVIASNAGNVLQVPGVAIDDYCNRSGIATVDLLKMDIEGGEADAVDGMREGIRIGRYRHVLLELHPEPLRQTSKSPEQILDAFLAHGYSCWRISDEPTGWWQHYSLRFRPNCLRRYDESAIITRSHFYLSAPDVPPIAKDLA